MEKSHQLFQVLQKTGFIIVCLFALWFVIILLQFIRETFTVWIERLNKKYPEPLPDFRENEKIASRKFENNFSKNSKIGKGMLKNKLQK